ncbi:MAG: TRAP transporter small permease subunit [Nitrospinaceae bacterium]|jgi:TRAP-type C4-dicarboxylate transport system permease small subunit|nr:TRAP transporter small permease subunit [Candidatus Lambdaproteobacteria bacterium]HIK58097.1 TRAP transporter small permease subunit [Nitrospinaceae bacterium]
MKNIILNQLRMRADNVAVGLLTAIFLSFILQIFSRYVIRQPLGWTLEACLLSWLWLIFWSTAFTLKEEDHVRFTMLSDHVQPAIQKIFVVISAICIITAMAVSLPATIDFVTFMSIEKTSLLKLRFDYVFSIYIIFSAAIISRYLWRLLDLLRGQDRERTK